MHLQSPQPYVAHFGGTRISPANFLKRNSKLVLICAGCDFCVRFRVHVRIDSNGNGRLFLESPRHAINPFQFRFTLHVERINSIAQRQRNLRLCLAHA